MTGRPAARFFDRIRLAPGSRIPLRDQIAVQVAAGLRTRSYGPGDRLPSARTLSRRLDVHRGTVRAAYRRLAGHGLVTVRPGSGVYVPAASDEPFRRFLDGERTAGRSFADVARLMDRWRRVVAARQVAVVGADAGLREVWTAELRPALEPLGVGLDHLSPGTARDEPRRVENAVVAGPGGALVGLDRHLPRWTATVPLRPGLSSRFRRLLVQSPEGAVLGLVTRSEALARQAGQMTASLRDGEVAVAAVEPEPCRRLERVLRVARFVLADMACRPVLRGRVETERLVTIRHLPRGAGRELARCFGSARGGDGVRNRPPDGEGRRLDPEREGPRRGERSAVPGSGLVASHPARREPPS